MYKMTNNLITVLVIITGSAIMANARPETMRHYCGSNLANKLKSVCSGRGYNGHSSGSSHGNKI